jgi:hypothetical protein
MITISRRPERWTRAATFEFLDAPGLGCGRAGPLTRIDLGALDSLQQCLWHTANLRGD